MNNVTMFGAKNKISLLHHFGVVHSFFDLNLTTIHGTWVALAVLTILIVCIRRALKNPHNILRYLALEGTASFIDLCMQSLGNFKYNHICFLFTLFVFIFLCNIVGIIPHVEEPTIDINTTFALGIISFLYINIYAIRVHGLKEYVKEFFEPFFIMFPLHVIGKLSSILSISFRLFGNIMGGFVISSMYFNAVGSSWTGILFNFITPFSFIITAFFGVFESIIQAFVFTLLSLTYLALAIQHTDKKKEAHV